MPIFVIGHQNPDTDAICSAIGYADFLKRTTRPKAVPACCGAIPVRTNYVLEQAGVPKPRLITSVRPTAWQVCQKDIVSAKADESFHSVYERMRDTRHRAIPIADEDNKLIGMVSIIQLLQLIMPEAEGARDGSSRIVQSSLEQVREALSGEFVNAVETDRCQRLAMMVGAMSAGGFTERLHKFPPEELIIVSGDRPTVHLPALEYGVRCLVVTGGFQLSPGLVTLAKQNNVTVLSSPLDTAMTTLLIKSARTVADAVDEACVTFSPTERVQDIRKVVASSAQVLFPVVDEDRELLGVFSKSDLVDPKPAQLILVDHNEYGQAVDGADEANILEVVDHHRLGGSLRTRHPIRFINDPVGSSSTIIARMYRQEALEPDPGVALCLCAGIISDTLFLKSPTTTSVDHEILEWLRPFTGRDLEEFATGFFAAGSALQVQTPPEAVREDCKEFAENGWRFTVSQIEEMNLDLFWKKQDELEAALAELRRERGLDFSCLMITDISKHNSLLLVDGDERISDAMEYPKKENNLLELSGVVSRKKQFLPHLTWVFTNLSREELLASPSPVEVS
jgi:manganese-dependent inorganic pyrophosphatase